MREVLSTHAIEEPDRWQEWQEFCRGTFGPTTQSSPNDAAFNACVIGTRVRELNLLHLTFDPLFVQTTPSSVRHAQHEHDNLHVEIRTSGVVHTQTRNYSSVQAADDITVRDLKSVAAMERRSSSDELVIDVPRHRLEGMLGSAKNFTGLTVNCDLPTATLARSFLRDLTRIVDRSSRDAAERMISIGIDLIVASIAERMAMEPPKALHGTLTVQRAKTYIETNLGDPDLDPPRVAAAVGVSLRHLQQLFHERGRHISDWIWKRRLEHAAHRVVDPTLQHLSIGDLSYGCGFVCQAHFSRRFKRRFGVSPNDFRRASMQVRAGDDS